MKSDTELIEGYIFPCGRVPFNKLNQIKSNTSSNKIVCRFTLYIHSSVCLYISYRLPKLNDW